MLRFLIVLLFVFASAQAQLLTGKGAELPLQIVKTPHFEVLHPPRLETFARRVAAAAEKIRSTVLETIGNDPERTFILVNDETDEFNGFAVPGPHPFIRVFATFPRPTDIGAQWEDAMHTLVTHEFTHVAHLSTRDDLRNSLRSIFGAVPGVLEARVPPAWFVEGYAVYLETKLTSGGRAQDSGIRTLRAQMARAGVFPSLSDAGIGVNENYPFGNTRYAFGAGFVAFLAERFGEAMIRQVIRLYNQRLTFAEAWQEVTQISLSDLWADWAVLETSRATREQKDLQNTGLEAGQPLHLGSGTPAWKADGSYAFMSGLTLRLKDKNGQLEPRSVTLPSRPNRLSWSGDALVYSRNVVRGATTYGEVFKLENGIEKQLTKNARARDAVTDGECILYVQDYLDNSSIRRICGAKDELMYSAPTGWHLFHLAPNTGNIALTVWRLGGFLDVAVLKNLQLEFLTSDRAQDQFPTWVSDSQLVFSSDRNGIAQLYQIKIGESQVYPLTSATGGAYSTSRKPSGELTFSSYTSGGFETRIISPKLKKAVSLENTQPAPLDNLSGLEYPIESYNAFPVPLFWYPLTQNGVGATIVGADPAGIFSWQLAAGFDVLGGTGFGTNFSLNFSPSLEWSANLFATADANTWGVQLSGSWVSKGETQFSGRVGYIIRPSIGIVNGTPFANLFTFLGTAQSDDWNYLEYGWGITGAISLDGYNLGLVLADNVSGLPIRLNLGLSGQFSSKPILSAGLQTQTSFGLHWRMEDGFLALERITFQPFINFLYSNSLEYNLGLRVLADVIFNYYAPISFGLEFNYGNGFTVRLVTMLPLEQIR
ncbi:MAG: hypothetical protein RLZZ156_238 [Deinococcota bacterium]|jgi:hypothetical protein